MKSKHLLFASIAAVFLFYSCSEKEKEEKITSKTTPKLSKTEYLGCFLGYENNKLAIQIDTLFYELTNDTLLLHLIMYQNCGFCHIDSVVTNINQVDIFISDTCGLVANCMCDFEFDYYFTDFNERSRFTVYYKPFDEGEYSFWAELYYP
jgi:hypothetical protein